MKRRAEFIKEVKQTLLARKNQMIQQVISDMGGLQQGGRSIMASDISDAAQGAELAEISSQLATQGSKELKQIVAALARITAGTYGVCEGCDRNIPIARLEVLPFASMCIKCQEEEERDGN